GSLSSFSRGAYDASEVTAKEGYYERIRIRYRLSSSLDLPVGYRHHLCLRRRWIRLVSRGQISPSPGPLPAQAPFSIAGAGSTGAGRFLCLPAAAGRSCHGFSFDRPMNGSEKYNEQ